MNCLHGICNSDAWVDALLEFDEIMDQPEVNPILVYGLETAVSIHNCAATRHRVLRFFTAFSCSEWATWDLLSECGEPFQEELMETLDQLCRVANIGGWIVVDDPEMGPITVACNHSGTPI